MFIATQNRPLWLLLTTAVLLVACVTINVYFPAAAVERAADRIIEDVWGEQPPPSSGGRRPPRLTGEEQYAMAPVFLDLLVRSASAQANINVSTPAINQLKSQMSARFQRLEPLYNAGAVGLTRDGLVTVRELQAVGLKARRDAQALVEQENQDRLALYREIARANNHPEWENDIRATFAKQWIEKARGGWWYQDGNGRWQQR